MKSKIIIAVCCFALGLLAENKTGLIQKTGSLIVKTAFKEEKIEKQEPPVPVRVMKVKLSDVEKTLDYVGGIEAANKAEVFPKVEGKIIKQLKKEGEAVKKGDVIFMIDRDEVGFEYELAPVESPIDGTVGNILVDLGDHVHTSTNVAVIVDIDSVEIELNIPEIYYPDLVLGQEALITTDSYPDKVFRGDVMEISPVIDPKTRTASLKIEINNEDNLLKPGMFARLSLIIDRESGVPVVLKEALKGGENPYVYVVRGGKAHRQNVKLGFRNGPYFWVREGLAEGDDVVIMGQQLLKEGRTVTIDEGISTK
ncbi:MAG: efflux RND transporter periplasmic adaptor subunit [Candidatus Aureabacteria bacterium]|nr:efflux RND transporter periplasmic adaptor subunit [Candidatus Auribacterota bacterium]